MVTSLATSLFWMVMLMSSLTWAGDCSGLKSELEMMRKAQNEIVDSLISNHEKMSSLLMENATGPRNSAAMISIAKAFDLRSTQARKLSEKMNEATEDLAIRIGKCLK